MKGGIPSREIQAAFQKEQKMRKTQYARNAAVKAMKTELARQAAIQQADAPTLTAYLAYLTSTGRAPLTAATYRLEIRRFLLWLDAAGTSSATVSALHLTAYLQERRTADNLRSTAKALSALRSFFRFIVDAGGRADNPADVLETARKPFRLPTVLSKETVDELFHLIDTTTPLGVRNRALYELIYSAGLRVSEAVSLNVQDIDFAEKLVRVWGKGAKERLVIFGETAALWLRRYIQDARPKLFAYPQRHGARLQALFLNQHGARLSRNGMWRNYRAIACRTGCDSKLHTLRHTFASELLAGGADIQSIQTLLGHADLTTTQRYIHINDTLLQEAHRRHLPRLGLAQAVPAPEAAQPPILALAPPQREAPLHAATPNMRLENYRNSFYFIDTA
jgi:integrase/recombinase XerD